MKNLLESKRSLGLMHCDGERFPVADLEDCPRGKMGELYLESGGDAKPPAK